MFFCETKPNLGSEEKLLFVYWSDGAESGKVSENLFSRKDAKNGRLEPQRHRDTEDSQRASFWPQIGRMKRILYVLNGCYAGNLEAKREARFTVLPSGAAARLPLRRQTKV